MANVGIVGATGLVGTLICEILIERKFPVEDLIVSASPRSVGKEFLFGDRALTMQDAVEADFSSCDVVLMSAGGEASRNYAEAIASGGATVVDNSSAWRSDPNVPLVVSEVNPEVLNSIPKGIVANPNCTTMVAAPVLSALNQAFGLNRVVATSFQSVSGSGAKGVAELQAQVDKVASDLSDLERSGGAVPQGDVYVEPIAFNALPIAGSLIDNETDEEKKFRNESRKILSLPGLSVTCTCVRVPVVAGHSLSLTVKLDREISEDEAIAVLESAKGLSVVDVPTPLKATGGDVTLVGRIRRDVDDPRTLHLFVAGDNLRKGAALNAVQIAELLIA